jgi:DNA modification methylase
MTRETKWLLAHEAELKRRNTVIRGIDLNKVDLDIKARRLEAKWAELYVRRRERLIEELDARGITEQNWCRTLGPGFSYTTVRRRIQLLAGFDRYLSRRAEIGDKFSLEHAVYLSLPEKQEGGTNSRPTRTQITDGILGSDPRHQFICGKAHIEQRKLPPQSVQVCVTSPPYWPLRRLYDMLADGTTLSPMPDTIGFEPTFEGYLDHVVRRDFRELRRVLRPDGTVFVVLDDVIANPGSYYDEQTYHSRRTKAKLRSQVGFYTQDTTKMRPKGCWLGLPWLFAFAMMDDGWFWRDLIIWDKGASGRKESADNRCRHNFEFILMFTLGASDYWYDQDPLPIPLSGGMPFSMKRGSTPGRHKGILRRGGEPDFRVASNPLGRVADAVWHIPAVGSSGIHSAVFPEELVRSCLRLGAPPPEMRPVGTVIDFYGGSGPVSVVAKRMGLNSVYIDSNPIYAAEAQQRVRTTTRDPDSGQ